MDWLGFGDYTYTTLGTGVSDKRMYMPCDFCMGYPCHPLEAYCICGDDDRPHDLSAVLVQAVGFPIPTLPMDTTYRIRGWREAIIQEDDADVSYFNDRDADLDIVLEPAVDARDMDHYHVKALLPFKEALLAVEPNAHTEFKGLKSKQAYISAFTDRVEAYFESIDRQPEPGPAPHVGRRKKGHSHVTAGRK